ncbi:MAG: transglycosylase domain-containing protein [Candidatus Woesearchaeota archaeon]
MLHDVPRSTRKLRRLKRAQRRYQKYQRSLSEGKFPPGLIADLARKAGKAAATTTAAAILTLTGIVGVNYAPTPLQHKPFKYIAENIHEIAGIQPLPDSLQTYTHSAKIVDNKGHTLKTFGKRIIENHIPDHIKYGLLACEDQLYMEHPNKPWHVNTFLVHPGVSWYNLFGATISQLKGYSRGGSTIAMQNAKKILHNNQRTIQNKLEEIIYSYNLISRFGKEKNLTFYINTVPLGNNIYGFPAAAKNYFGKELQGINYQQVVALGATIPNHNRIHAFYRIINGKSIDELSPFLQYHANEGINKMNLALKHLHSLEEITDAEYKKWKIEDEKDIQGIGFREFKDPLYGKEEWATWNIIRTVTNRTYNIDGREVSGRKLLLEEEGDFVIHTDIDTDLTRRIKEIAHQFTYSDEYEKTLKKRNKNTWLKDKERYDNPPYEDFEDFIEYTRNHLDIGIIAIDNEGDIITYIGGNNFREKGVTIDTMNRNATLHPGSTMKPIIAYYAMAFTGITPKTTFEDRPIELKFVESEGRRRWLPRNWYPYSSKRPLGARYSLEEAQVLSVNTIFARLYTKDIIRNSMHAGFESIDLEYNREDARYWPFGIGASEIPVQDWLGIYSAFLDGHFKKPSFIKKITRNGEMIYSKEDDPNKEPILLFEDDYAREKELEILYEVCNRGSGKSMRSEFKQHINLVSGKTGTESKERESLFISHFNPYRDRESHPEKTITMIVYFTTSTGGYKRVGMSTEGPTNVAGTIYKDIFFEELKKQSQAILEKDKTDLNSNDLYLANINRYMKTALEETHDGGPINRHIHGVDGYTDLLRQLLNHENSIYEGKDDSFKKLIEFYCQDKLIR